jgi:TonB family protein
VNLTGRQLALIGLSAGVHVMLVAWLLSLGHSSAVAPPIVLDLIEGLRITEQRQEPVAEADRETTAGEERARRPIRPTASPRHARARAGERRMPPGSPGWVMEHDPQRTLAAPPGATTSDDGNHHSGTMASPLAPVLHDDRTGLDAAAEHGSAIRHRPPGVDRSAGAAQAHAESGATTRNGGEPGSAGEWGHASGDPSATGSGSGASSGAPGASRGAGADTGPRGEGSGPAGPSEGEYGPYLRAFRQRLQRSLHYPLAARRQGLAGSVELEVVLEPSGRVKSVRVLSSSSHAMLDAAAVTSVTGMAPLPLPPELAARPLAIRVPLSFELR